MIKLTQRKTECLRKNVLETILIQTAFLEFMHYFDTPNEVVEPFNISWLLKNKKTKTLNVMVLELLLDTEHLIIFALF